MSCLHVNKKGTDNNSLTKFELRTVHVTVKQFQNSFCHFINNFLIIWAGSNLELNEALIGCIWESDCTNEGMLEKVETEGESDGEGVHKSVLQNTPNNVLWRTSIDTIIFPQHQMFHL